MKIRFRQAAAAALALCLLLACCPFAVHASSGTCGTNAVWQFDEDTGALTISGTGAMTNYSFYTATPWYSFLLSIRSVTILDGVTKVGKYAFDECANLERVTIAGGVTEIGSYTFYNCPRLAQVTLPDTLAKIGSYAFRNCTGLVNLDVPGSVSSIGSYAFDGVGNVVYSGTATGSPWGAKNLNRYAQGVFVFESESMKKVLWCSRSAQGTVTVPGSVTGIIGAAFSGCAEITGITIPASVLAIDGAAFSGCTSLSRVDYTGSLAQWCEITFENFAANPVSFAHALYIGGTLLTRAVIPQGVQDIGDYAFRGCEFLTEVVLPDSLTSIGDDAFQNCTGICAFSVGDGNTAFCADANGVLYESDGSELVLYPIGRQDSLFTVPDSVTSICAHAFYGSPYLLSVTIPDSVTAIGENAFYGVGHLAYTGNAFGSPWGASYVNQYTQGDFVFDSAEMQTLLLCSRTVQGALTVPDGVTVIGTGAFRGCRNLQNVLLPDSLERIESEAFADTSLSRLDIPQHLQYLGTASLPQTVTLITVADGIGSLAGEDLFGTDDTPEFFLITGDGLTSIPDCLSGAYAVSLGSGFNGSEDCLGSARPHHVHLSDAITSLGENALTGVNYICAAAGNTFAENYARAHQMGFRVCAGHADGADLDAMDFYGESVYMRYDAETDTHFLYGTGPTYDRDFDESGEAGRTIRRLVVEAGVSRIGCCVFQSCGIGELVLPDAQITLCDDAFCSGTVERVTFPQSATDVSQYAIGDDAFPSDSVFYLDLGGLDGLPDGFLFGYGDNYSLQSLIVGANTRQIPEYACNCFSALRTVTLPDGLTQIGDYAFEGCDSLLSVTFPDSVTRIGAYAFDYCASLAQADLPDSLTQIGDYAFCCCAALTEVMIPSGVKTIGAEAFTGTGLQSVHLPAGLEEISPDAFDAAALSYVCCDTENCPVVRQYAEEAGIELRLCDGHGVVAPRLAGDANVDGSVDLKDVTAIRRYLAGGWNVTVDASNADVDADGRLTMRDVVLLSRYLAGGWDVILL